MGSLVAAEYAYLEGHNFQLVFASFLSTTLKGLPVVFCLLTGNLQNRAIKILDTLCLFFKHNLSQAQVSTKKVTV